MTDRNIHSDSPAFQWRAVVQILRIHQWTKNLLLFIPLLLAHKSTETARLWATLVACVSFCLGASSLYIVNDWLDRAADRQHPSKRFRPFAAGSLSFTTGGVLMLLLLASSVGLAVARLPASFVAMLGLYLVISAVYSLIVKQVAILDVLVLAGVYLLRILAGGTAADVFVSPWLLAFSGFLFLSIAFVKRYAELERLPDSDQAVRRGYTRHDKELLRGLGTSSGYLCVLVLALYIHNSQDVPILYTHPTVLWLVCPCVLYWISRVWLLAHRGSMGEDPVWFVLSDPASYVVGALIVGLVLAAV